MSEYKKKIFFYDTINILILPNVLFNYLLKRKIFIYRSINNQFGSKILNYIIKILKIKKLNFFDKNPHDYIKSFDIKFYDVNKYYEQNVLIGKFFILFKNKFILDDNDSSKKLETLIKNELYKYNIDQDYASILLLEKISKNQRVTYYPSNLTTYLLLDQRSLFKISKLLIITNLIIYLFGHIKKIRLKYTKKNKFKSVKKEDNNCQIGFIPHKNFKYGNAFKKNYLFDSNKNSAFYKDNILNIFFENLDYKTHKYLKLNKMQYIILKITFRDFILIFLKNISFIFKVFFTGKKSYLLSILFLKIFFQIKFAENLVNKYVKISKIFFHYDVLVSPYFCFALHLKSIKTFAVQERPFQYLYFRYYFFDHYFTVNNQFNNLLSKNGYYVSHYSSFGLPRAYYADHLLKNRLFKNNFHNFRSNFLFIGLLCSDDESIGSFGEDGTSIKSNLNFLNLIDDVSTKYPSIGMHISFKEHRFLNKKVFQPLYNKLKLRKNIFFYNNDQKSNIYILSNYSNLIISKYSSIVDDMLSIGKKVLIDDTEKYICNFNYYLSDDPICITSKKEILEAIDNYKDISFSKYDNFFNKKYSYEEYYNNIKDYIIHH